MGKDIGFCSITEDICRKEGECEKCSLKHIHENIEHYAKLHEQGRLIEQKHGTWESLDTYVYECDGMWECSECGEDFYFEFGTPLECRAYYCPNCGAKMFTKEEAEAKLAELKGE